MRHGVVSLSLTKPADSFGLHSHNVLLYLKVLKWAINKVSASLTALTIKQKVLPLHFLILSNFHNCFNQFRWEHPENSWGYNVVWSCYQKTIFVCIFPAIMLVPARIWLKIQMWLINNHCPYSRFSTSKDVT